MTRSHYELLGVSPNAPLDEIKKGFRREIAKYHPDKVQHLGPEFQEIAATKAGELTRAYKTLCDESLRAEYDRGMAKGAQSGGPILEWTPWGSSVPTAADAGCRPATGRFTAHRAGASDLLRKAALARCREAITAQFGSYDEVRVQGFEMACAPSKGRFWSNGAPLILVRVVPQVDAAAVAESWRLATRMPGDKDVQRRVCIFLIGPAVAPPGELARAIAEARRRADAQTLFLVPVNMRSWMAHIPVDAPAVVKALLERLKSL